MANDMMVLRPSNFGELTTFAQMAARSGMVPKDYIGKPEAIMLAVQMGSELGLAPMQSLQNIACINGRPSVWGDAMLALCKNSPLYGGIEETIVGSGDAMEAICVVNRKGDKPVEGKFSAAQAKKAGLWGKVGPWASYPQRMLQMRARGFALRDAFPDVLRGLISAEEAQDIPVDTFAGTTVEAKAEPTPPTFEEQAVAELENEPNGTKWLNLLGFWVNRCGTMDDLAVIRGLPSFRKASEKAPPMIRDQLKDMMRAAVDRLAPQPEPEPAEKAVDMMFEGHVQAPPTPDERLEDIRLLMNGMESADDIKAWAASYQAEMSALRKDSPEAFGKALALIDERRLQLEG